MFKKLLGKTLAELPPMVRLLILMPICALVVLATVVSVLWNKGNSRSVADDKAKDAQILFWENQSASKDRTIELKQYRIDSMTTKAYNDKVETNRQLQLIIDKQNNQKKLLRTIK